MLTTRCKFCITLAGFIRGMNVEGEEEEEEEVFTAGLTPVT